MSKLINISDSFCSAEAHDAAVLNCYAFRRGTDERNGMMLWLGNMVNGIALCVTFYLLLIHFFKNH